MGLFDFAKEAGETLRRGLGGKDGEDADAQELAQALTRHGVTIESGKISVKDDVVTITGIASDRREKELAVLILGNTKGVARVVDQMTLRPAATGQPAAGSAASATSPAAPESRFYTVRPGDSLSKIARDLLGDADRYPEIFEANRPMLSDPDKIYPGQTLRIPGRAEN